MALSLALLTLGFYLLRVARWHLRPRPTLVGGGWDMAWLVLGASGLLVLEIPQTMARFHESWRAMAVSRAKPGMLGTGVQAEINPHLQPTRGQAAVFGFAGLPGKRFEARAGWQEAAVFSRKQDLPVRRPSLWGYGVAVDEGCSRFGLWPIELEPLGSSCPGSS